MSSIATTCAAHIEDCEGWWLSFGHRLVVEHWQLKLQDEGALHGLIPGDCRLFNFPPFCLITSKHVLQTFSFYVATCGYLTCSNIDVRKNSFVNALLANIILVVKYVVLYI